MRNYIDPKMNISMFETENVVVTQASALTQANDFFGSTDAGANTNGSGPDNWANQAVAAGNVLNFTY